MEFKTMHNLIKLMFVIWDVIISFTLVICFSLLIPMFVMRFLFPVFGWNFDSNTRVYILLTTAYVLITFLGYKFNRLIIKFFIYDPFDDSRFLKTLYKEDISKTVFFLLNLVAIFVTTISKYNHLKFAGLTDEGMNPFVQSFVTYIALDRVVTTYRKAREPKVL